VVSVISLGSAASGRPPELARKKLMLTTILLVDQAQAEGSGRGKPKQ